MTLVKVKKKDGSFSGLECVGHSGYSVEGEDIVCASLSGIIQTALLGLIQVAGIDVKFKRDEKRGYLEFYLPDKITPKQREYADVIMDTCICGVNDLEAGYSDFIELQIKN
jgi:uncharacterized protein YsxB (DUF464 family)